MAEVDEAAFGLLGLSGRALRGAQQGDQQIGGADVSLEDTVVVSVLVAF